MAARLVGLVRGHLADVRRWPGGRATCTEKNWLQTIPGKGWFLRLGNPLQSFFDKTWRSSEIQQV